MPASVMRHRTENRFLELPCGEHTHLAAGDKGKLPSLTCSPFKCLLNVHAVDGRGGARCHSMTWTNTFSEM